MKHTTKKQAKHPWYSIARLLIQLVWAGLMVAGLIYKSAALVIAFMALSVLFGNAFCGWLCPFGSIQEYLSRLGSKITRRKLRLPVWLDRWLSLFRYVLLGLLLAGVWQLWFFNDPYTTFLAVLDANFAYIATGSILFLTAFLVLSMFMDRPFCRYLCTEGAQYGLTSLIRVFTITRNAQSCTSCKLCDKACPSGISVSTKSQVRDAACIDCLECIKACPQKGTLRFRPAVPNLKELVQWRKTK
ncbi:MAG: 4Fe-4S binding protein [Spirochaetes bacterium]|nr:4Fe-4S binding protein [Spirochaetota bacterium]